MREKIIEALSTLQSQPTIHAGWLEGSMAVGSHDELSDIDIWFDVTDGSEDFVFSQVIGVLRGLGTIDKQYEQPSENRYLRYRVFHLAETPPTLTIEVNLQAHSRKFQFTEGIKGQEVKVLFDKSNVIDPKKLDEAKLGVNNAKRLQELKSLYHGRRSDVNKQIQRGQFLEALLYYHRWVLEPLIEVVRIAHQPTKTDYGLKHIYQDVPANITKTLEDLYKVAGVNELPVKIQQADILFQKVYELASAEV